MDNIIKTITSLLPLAIFALGVVMWIFIIRWERKMIWHIDNAITIEDIPAMRLRRVSDDPTLNAFGYGMQLMEDGSRCSCDDYAQCASRSDIEMDRKEFGEDDPSWNSITQMYDEIDRG